MGKCWNSVRRRVWRGISLLAHWIARPKRDELCGWRVVFVYKLGEGARDMLAKPPHTSPTHYRSEVLYCFLPQVGALREFDDVSGQRAYNRTVRTAKWYFDRTSRLLIELKDPQKGGRCLERGC